MLLPFSLISLLGTLSRFPEVGMEESQLARLNQQDLVKKTVFFLSDQISSGSMSRLHIRLILLDLAYSVSHLICIILHTSSSIKMFFIFSGSTIL